MKKCKKQAKYAYVLSKRNHMKQCNKILRKRKDIKIMQTKYK